MHNQTNQAYQEIKHRILNGTLRPSESLTEMGLASELGVSRSTVKNALLKLESESLVVIMQNKSARVRSFSIEEVLQNIQVRELLEGFIVSLSAPLLSEEDLAELGAILKEMEACFEAKDFMQYSQNNWRFHDVLYRVCPNKAAVEITMDIKNQLKRYNLRTILVRGRDESSLQEHRGILQALMARDTARAEALMREHIANVGAVLKDNYSLLF